MRRFVLLLVAAMTLLPGRPADAQSPPPPTLGGYTGSAAASGLRVLYNPVGLLPLGTLLDLSVPDALATIANGPSTFARASVADPGDLLANPDALIQQAAGAAWEAGTIPAYPFRISASSGVGDPTDELSAGPGLVARVAAEGSESSAEATLPGAAAPTLVSFGSASSRATTSVDGSTVTVRATASIGNLSVLGLLIIDSLVTDLTATSDGTTTTVTGGTEVVGASILGQPVEIDAGGIDGFDALRPLGIAVTLAGPVEQGDDATAGQLTAAGLRIDVELSEATFPLLGQLLDALPSPLVPGLAVIDDVLAAVRAHHLVSVSLAGASVSLTARPTAARPAVTTPPTTAAPASPSTGVRPSSSPTVARPAVSTPAAPSLLPATPVAAPGVEPQPLSGLATGVGGIALLLLLAQPFLGAWLARGASLITGSGAANHCAREGP